MSQNKDLPTPEEIIESISEWPVTDYTSPVEKITNPDSVSSFFLRNVGRNNKKSAEQLSRRQVEPTGVPEVTVDIALARWWRKCGKQSLLDTEYIPNSHNPNTIINFAARTDAGTKFILDEIKRLRTKISEGNRSHDVYSALSSFYEQILNLSLAKMYLETAVEKNTKEMEYLWRLHRLKRMTDIRRSQEELLKSRILEDAVKTMPEPKIVKRVAADHLSFSEFFYSYALTSSPVVITGMVDKMTKVPWTFQHISDIAGECLATLKHPVKDSVKWAGLEEGESVKVKDFIRDLKDRGDLDLKGDLDLQYLFDWCLPTHCPTLASELTIPKYFAGDFLQRTAPDSYYRESFPSLFIAPSGITSELHVDTFGSNFWMALFQGRKRWTFFSKEDMPKLYPSYSCPLSSDPVFQVNLDRPDVQEHKLLSLTQPMQCVLEPGELLFVPAGCPHRVENLENSLAISGNYVDLSNFDQVKQELAMASIIHSQSKALLDQLSDPDFPSNMDSEISDLEWQDFKSWPPKEYKQYDITVNSVKNYLSQRNKESNG